MNKRGGETNFHWKARGPVSTETMDRDDWHPADVIAALRKTPEQWTLRGLSLANNYSANAANIALRKPWPAVEEFIAHALGMHPQDLWPSRYDEAGQPLRRETQRDISGKFAAAVRV
ncbi:MAG TPA: helix-turn-helix domain-containing protein [Longimicrobium sp.]|jgi:Ner family transcriptional regulator